MVEYQYVIRDNPYMKEAKKVALASGCIKQKTGAVVVLNTIVIGRGNNDAKAPIDRHFNQSCPRDYMAFQTGEGYHLCKSVCHQKAHCEVEAINDALKLREKSGKYNIYGADLYLYGHYYCCENCWSKILDNGISNVYLLEGASDTTDWRPT